MTSEKVRETFLKFFEERGHKVIASSSLIPDDPTSLFTSAGMQQLALYLEGTKDVLADFNSQHLASSQKCFRTGDIEEVGDATHHTFFEMLGNWSVGENEKTGYFKEGAIKYAIEFLCDTLNLDKNRIWTTIFKGEQGIPKDTDSLKIWQEQGIPKERIKEYCMLDNFWGPVTETGACGPCTEIHYDKGEEFGCKDPDCGPNCEKCQRFCELWNLVFMEFNKKRKDDGSFYYEKLPQKNVDTGIGFERLVAFLQNKNSSYETDLFLPTIELLEENCSKDYSQNKKNFRLIADHLRASVFLISAGILPSNLDRGYVLRRLIRRVIRTAKLLELKEGWEIKPVRWIIKKYSPLYSELNRKENDVLIILQKEKEKFDLALSQGMKHFAKIAEQKQKEKNKVINGPESFFLYESYGFPLEMIKELAQEKDLKVDKKGFNKALEKHQKISRKGAEKKFGGLGRKASPEAIKLHTATHLLHEALRQVLGEHVQQMGSDITSERLRFDFSHPEKLTVQELEKVEKLVNEKIKQGLEVKQEEMDYQAALKAGALAFFMEKYPQRVNVYTIFNPQTSEVFSKEICAGPHIKRTSDLGNFKIIKEESSAKGIRRIKAVLK